MPSTFRFFLVVVVVWATPALAQDGSRLKVEFEEHLVLGNDEDKSMAFVFSGVRDISVDEEGNLYVADAGSREIRVFSEEGAHLRTLGRRGQGPGEFQDVSAMAVDAEGNVLVVDRMLQRVTRYLKAKDYRPQTYSLPAEGVPWVYGLHLLGSGEIALVYKSLRAGRPWNQGDRHTELVHIYDSSFTRVVDETVSYADFYDPDESFYRALTDIPSARFSVDREGNILVVPRLYEGSVYEYERSGNDWVKRVWDGGTTQTIPPTSHVATRSIRSITFHSDT